MIQPFREKIWFDDSILSCDRIEEGLLAAGYTVYEVVRVMDGHILFEQDHLRRLRVSARNAGFDLWLSDSQISHWLAKLVSENGSPDGNIELSVNYRNETCPHTRHIMAWYIPHVYPSSGDYETGVPTVFYFSERVNPGTKYRNMPLKEAARAMMDARQAYEVILVDKQGMITEGSRSNIFFIHENTICTAPVDKVLPGITRMKVVELAKHAGIEVVEKCIHYQEIEKQEAAFITGTSPKVLPIRQIENTNFDIAHPLLVHIIQLYDDCIRQYLSRP
jgi:branched-chain amino acid aminotransferase